MKQEKPKPWYRLRNIILAIVFAIVAFSGWAFLEVWQVYKAEPSPKVNYRQVYRDQVIKDYGINEDNAKIAWDLLQDAIQVQSIEIRRVMDEIDTIRSTMTYEEGLDVKLDMFRIICCQDIPTDIKWEEKLLTALKNNGCFELLDKHANAAPGLKPVSFIRPIAFELFPELGQSRGLVRNRLAASRLALHHGDKYDLLPAIESCLALSKTVSFQFSDVSRLIAISIDGMILYEIKHQLMEAQFDEQTYRALLELLTVHSLLPLSLMIDQQRSYVNDTMEWLFSDSGYMLLDKFATKTNLQGYDSNLLLALQERFLLQTKSEVSANTEQWFNFYEQEVNLLPSKRWANGSHPDIVDEQLSADPLSVYIWLLPRLRSNIGEHTALTVEMTGTRILIAIELFAATQGRYPDSLSDLVPDYLSKLLNDPIHGKPFGYYKSDDDPHGRPYILYSYGIDGVDDGGQEYDNDKSDFYTNTDPLIKRNIFGVDYIINKPRRPEEF